MPSQTFFQPRLVSEVFSTPGTYDWVSPLTGPILLVGVGGGAGGGGGSNATLGGSGGKGALVSGVVVQVNQGQTYSLTIGAGGIGTPHSSNSGGATGTDGADSLFDSLATFPGAKFAATTADAVAGVDQGGFGGGVPGKGADTIYASGGARGGATQGPGSGGGASLGAGGAGGAAGDGSPGATGGGGGGGSQGHTGGNGGDGEIQIYLPNIIS